MVLQRRGSTGVAGRRSTPRRDGSAPEAARPRRRPGRNGGTSSRPGRGRAFKRGGRPVERRTQSRGRLTHGAGASDTPPGPPGECAVGGRGRRTGSAGAAGPVYYLCRWRKIRRPPPFPLLGPSPPAFAPRPGRAVEGGHPVDTPLNSVTAALGTRLGRARARRCTLPARAPILCRRSTAMMAVPERTPPSSTRS